MLKNGTNLKIFIYVVTFLFLISNNRTVSSDEREQLNRKIKQLQEKISEQEAREASTLDLLQNIDHEMMLTRQHIQKLKQAEKTKRSEITLTEKKLEQTKQEISRLKDLLAKRAIYLYKKSHVRDIEILFSANSFNQVLLWLKFQKLLAENDRRNIENIAEKQAQIASHKVQLRQMWDETQNLLHTKSEESERLKQRKQQRKQVLVDIRKNIKKYQEEVENSLAQIRRIIRAQENTRKTRIQEVPTYSEFPELKGALTWPLRGKIIKRFGNYRHPELKTITKSLGIDIRSKPGTPVQAVANGIISRIQWMRGIGVLILLNHYGGYYTVYANLGEVFVKQDEYVQTGQILGNVGEPGIDNRARLHFEIWEKSTAVNPEKWLRR